GDFDPSGEDIDRDFTARTDCWAKVIRVALTAGQVEEYDLPPMQGKATDSRAKGFEERHGRLVQVEVDALDPPDMRGLYAREIERWHDPDTFHAVLADEAEQRERLHQLAGREH